MEDWKVLYASKLMTADEAVRQIPDGSRVFFGHAANEPPVLVDALVRNYEQYKDVEIVHWVPMGKGEMCIRDRSVSVMMVACSMLFFSWRTFPSHR